MGSDLDMLVSMEVLSAVTFIVLLVAVANIIGCCPSRIADGLLFMENLIPRNLVKETQLNQRKGLAKADLA